MSHQSLLFALIAITFFAAIGWAVYQRMRVRNSQQKSGDPEGDKATSEAAHAHENKH